MKFPRRGSPAVKSLQGFNLIFYESFKCTKMFRRNLSMQTLKILIYNHCVFHNENKYLLKIVR